MGSGIPEISRSSKVLELLETLELHVWSVDI